MWHLSRVTSHMTPENKQIKSVICLTGISEMQFFGFFRHNLEGPILSIRPEATKANKFIKHIVKEIEEEKNKEKPEKKRTQKTYIV